MYACIGVSFHAHVLLQGLTMARHFGGTGDGYLESFVMHACLRGLSAVPVVSVEMIIYLLRTGAEGDLLDCASGFVRLPVRNKLSPSPSSLYVARQVHTSW